MRLALQDQQIASLRQTLHGVSGNNGVYGDLRAFRGEFQRYVSEEQQRREAEAKDRLSGQRAVVIALLAAVVALIGTVASLIVVVAA